MVAVMVEVRVSGPAYARPTTRPEAETLATSESVDTYAAVRPTSVRPAASFGTATICAVRPAIIVTSLSSTVATVAGVTVRVAEPLCPSLVAVTIAVRVESLAYATAVTNPIAEIVATVGSLMLQTRIRAVSSTPSASCSVAVSCSDCPDSIDGGSGLRVIVATGA